MEQPSEGQQNESIGEVGQTASSFDYSSSYTQNLPYLLKALNISLVMTSYQAGQVIVIRSDGERLDTDFKAFPRPMGLAVDEQRIVLGSWSQVLSYRRNDGLLSQPSRDGKADACFVPAASHVTGMINIHDIAWGDDGLWVVNSSFSCLATLTPGYNFVPRWKPPFISELVAEDRCHLNGMAMKDGKPKYVSTFNQSDSKGAWRHERRLDGTIIDVDSNEILVDDLIMPHSPRYYRERLYFCESGRGLVHKFDPVSREKKVIANLQGFTRGLAFYGPLMFVGTSRTRKSERVSELPLNQECDETIAGVWVINLDDESIVGQLVFDGDIEQIYDIAILQGSAFPELLLWDDERVNNTFEFPLLTPCL
ncbi:TIGR03032 family protein [Vibrio diabolicus]|uniref:TIGR03032 family protein n=1 Tax=Vibrio diabolicus TaxID=50719 RepID=UPI001C7173AB|nr:TIGR03032 family protein [Vibrio diabolicus]